MAFFKSVKLGLESKKLSDENGTLTLSKLDDVKMFTIFFARIK